MHPDDLYKLAKNRQRDSYKEVEQDRLVMKALASQPSLITRLLEALGGFMIKIGERLQKRHAPRSTGKLRWVDK